MFFIQYLSLDVALHELSIAGDARVSYFLLLNLLRDEYVTIYDKGE